ncbi:MAG: sodium:proton antiporter [Phycisphaerales bacterium]
MSLVIAICVAVIFMVSLYLMLGRELKEIAMGVFLLGHAANLAIIAMSGSPVKSTGESLKSAPILGSTAESAAPLAEIVDPLPQALILTAIVISFAVMCFLLTLIVLTARRADTINVDALATEQLPTP